MDIYSAEKVLNKTDFDNYLDWQTYPTKDYHCTNCNQEVAISFKNLSKHHNSNFSNFSQEDMDAFGLLEKENPAIKTDSFLDFYCPKCKRPVRIYYNMWAGGKHGEFGFSIKFIVF